METETTDAAPLHAAFVSRVCDISDEHHPRSPMVWLSTAGGPHLQPRPSVLTYMLYIAVSLAARAIDATGDCPSAITSTLLADVK
ncbi:hypothetical protein BKA93DRAFT_317670 [Sparassis latifolia]